MKRCATAVLAVALLFPAAAQASVTDYLWLPKHIMEVSPNPSSLFKAETVKANQPYIGSPTLRGVYMKASRSNAQSSFPASWYLRDASGNKVKDKKFGYYIMNPLSTGWQQHVASSCERLTLSRNATICYLDGMGSLSLDRATVPLIDPRTGQPFTKAGWLRDAGAEVKAVEDASTSFYVVVNSVEAGVQYYSQSNPTRYLATGWGVSSEQFPCKNPGRQFRMIDSTHVWAITKEDSAACRRKALAIFLLAAGRGDKFDSYSWTDGAGTWYPEYNLNLGSPKAGRVEIASRVWKRAFSNGYVFLNNTTHTVHATAGGHTYKLLPKKQRFVVL